MCRRQPLQPLRGAGMSSVPILYGHQHGGLKARRSSSWGSLSGRYSSARGIGQRASQYAYPCPGGKVARRWFSAWLNGRYSSPPGSGPRANPCGWPHEGRRAATSPSTRNPTGPWGWRRGTGPRRSLCAVLGGRRRACRFSRCLSRLRRGRRPYRRPGSTRSGSGAPSRIAQEPLRGRSFLEHP
jgi:hypothetical protein